MGVNFAAPFALLKPIDVDPMKYATQYANLAALAQERGLRQQQIAASQQEMQENALKIQNMQQDIADQKTIQTLMPQYRANPAFQDAKGGLDFNKVWADLDGKIAPRNYDAFQKIVIGNQDSAAQIAERTAAAAADQAKANDSARAAQDAFNNHVGNVAQDILDHSDPGTVNPALVHGMLQHALSTWGDSDEHKQVLANYEQQLTANPDSAYGILQELAGNLTPEQREARSKAAGEATRAKTALIEQGTKQFAAGVQMVNSLPTDPATGLPTQNSWTATQKAHPELNLPDSPTQAAINKLNRSTVPVAEQPKYDLETTQAKALQALVDGSPQDLDNLIDSIVPKNDPMNASTKSLAHHAAAMGNAAGVQKVIQDAYDQRGRVQVAKETQANRISLDLGSIGGSPSQPSDLAKAVADYRMPLSSAVGHGGPAARKALMSQVLAYNPDFQEQYYNTFQSTEKDAVTGKIGTNANALNTMMGHLGVLNQAADALQKNDIQAMNRIANWVGVQTGDTAKTTYDTILHRLGPEVTKAYIASGGSVGERGTNEADFGSNLSPAQIKANIGVSALLADSKIKALQDQYSRGTYGRGQQKLISDEAETARQSLVRQSPGGLGEKTPSGGYKTGDKRVVNGRTYVRGRDGNWNPQ